MAGLAIVFSAGLIVAMFLFARKANQEPSFVNWYGLATAIGGTLVFESLKYAFTVRSRHRAELSEMITLTPAKIDELSRLVDEVEKTRRLYSGLTTAIELRAKELMLEYERSQLEERASELRGMLVDLEQRQKKLALDSEAQQAGELAEEMSEIVKMVGVSRADRSLDRIWRVVAILPILPGGAVLIPAAEAIQHRIERRIAQRKRLRVAELNLKDEKDDKNMQDDSV
jgi:hypothetical protein